MSDALPPLSVTVLERARQVGAEYAQREHEDGLTANDEPCGQTYNEQQDVIRDITSIKYQPDSWAGSEILDAFENGYFDWWDENEDS